MIINGYSGVQTQDYGTHQGLPAGAYCATILRAEQTTTQNGSPAVKVAFDIASGQYAGYFTEDFRRRQKFSADAKFGGVKLHVLTEKALPFFKGFITAVEQSNPGVKIANGDDVNLEALKGKNVGLIMRREEYRKNDGTTAWSTKQCGWTDVKKVIAGEIQVPEDKPLGAQKPAGGGYAAATYSSPAYIPGAYTDASSPTAASAPKFEEIDPNDPDLPF